MTGAAGTNTTFAAIRSVLEDLFTVFPDGFVHLGGDEVSTHCWNTTAHVVVFCVCVCDHGTRNLCRAYHEIS